MALQVWLPLNGSMENQGLLNLTPTQQGTISWIDGKIGKCLSAGNANQTTNGISYNSNLTAELGTEFSAAVWVKPLGNHVHYNGTFVSSGNWNAKRWAFGVNQNNSQVDVFCQGHNTYIACQVPVNTWTHLCCVHQGTTVKLYKNGEYVGEKTGVPEGLESDATNFCVGRETYASGYFSFNGNLNDLRIYNHALSLKEIKELAKGLILHYKLDDLAEEYNNIVFDSSGYKNNGTLISAPTLSTDSARYSKSTSFDGTDDGILIQDLQLSNIINSEVTYAFWIKPNGEAGARSVYFGSYSGISWSIEKTTGNILRLYWNGSPDETTWGVAIADNIWQHICITKKGTNDIKVYINGEQKWVSTAAHNALTFPTTYRIGRDVRSGDNIPYKGLMSDFRIYATALSAEDVAELYHTAASIDSQGNLFCGEVVE